jgi:hypothetical protein
MKSCTLFRGFALASVAAIFGAFPIHAQVVIGPPRTIPGFSTAAASNLSTPGSPGSLATIASVFARQGPLVRWGQLAVRPYTSYSITRDDGFFRPNGMPVDVTIQGFTQGLALELGKTWSFDGVLSYSTYSEPSLKGATTGSMTLGGRWEIRDWQVSASQHYSSNAPFVVETGGQNAERTFSSRIGAGTQIGDKTSLQVGGAWTKRVANPLTSNVAWTGSDWNSLTGSVAVQYNVSQKLNFTASVNAGHDEISANPNMSHYGPQLRVQWRPTARLSASAGGGYESRTVHGTDGGTTHTPVYDASLAYSPTETTTLGVSASRSVTTSYFNDQTSLGESWSANLGQRLFTRFFLSASYSEGRTTYDPTTRRVTSLRADRYRATNASLSTAILKRGSVSLTAGRSRNLSDRSLFAFASTQYGASFNYRF